MVSTVMMVLSRSMTRTFEPSGMSADSLVTAFQTSPSICTRPKPSASTVSTTLP